MNDEVNNQLTEEQQESAAEAQQKSAEELDEEIEKELDSIESESAEIQSLKEQLSSAEEAAATLKDRMLRIQADFENFRKRTQREKEDLAQYTKEEFVKLLLPVLDNFDLALAHSSTENPESYKQGVELVAKQLLGVLEKEGLTEIPALGETFNPNYHHGVANDNNPEVEDQKITEVFQKGYELKDKVLRPSMVKVNQNT